MKLQSILDRLVADCMQLTEVAGIENEVYKKHLKKKIYSIENDLARLESEGNR